MDTTFNYYYVCTLCFQRHVQMHFVLYITLYYGSVVLVQILLVLQYTYPFIVSNYELYKTFITISLDINSSQQIIPFIHWQIESKTFFKSNHYFKDENCIFMMILCYCIFFLILYYCIFFMILYYCIFLLIFLLILLFYTNVFYSQMIFF